MNILSSCAALCAAIAFCMPSGPALGWGHEGHEVVGSIADQLLEGHPAKAQVARILGFELRVAAPWLDCVRSVVHHTDDDTFEYDPDPHHPEYRVPCTSFETPSEKARMEDYVKRNWTTCVYKPGHGCHETYHFADVAIQHRRYDRSFAGTSEHDIVSAINAAVAKLKNPSAPAPAPLSITDQKEALFLLAHLLGDLHQPLHVGAVYLNSRGRRLNPPLGRVDPETETAGGNYLFDGHTKLHTEWDEIPHDLGRSANPKIVQAARPVPASPGQLANWPAAWATDTIEEADKAFAGLTFSKHGDENWAVRMHDHSAYVAAEDKLKREQLAKAGAHLAELLKAIWQ